jgi:hypothetical protein
MKYSYFMEFNTVTEYDAATHESVESWHIDSLRANSFKNIGGDVNIKRKHITLSYTRTREWALENYPELFL